MLHRIGPAFPKKKTIPIFELFYVEATLLVFLMFFLKRWDHQRGTNIYYVLSHFFIGLL